MFSQLMLAGPDLIQGFLLASVVGLASYFGLLLIKRPQTRSRLALLAFLVFAAACYRSLVPSAFLYVVCAALLTPVPGAFAQRYVVANGKGWLDGYTSLLLSTFLAVFGVYLIYIYARPVLFSISDREGLLMLVVSVVMPTINAFFLWLLKSSRLRPGMDTHLHKGEYAG